MNLKAQKQHHKRKLRILGLIELCEEYIKREYDFLERIPDNHFIDLISGSNKRIERFERIKEYLLTRYKN